MEKNTSIIDEWVHKLASRGCTMNQVDMREMFKDGLRGLLTSERRLRDMLPLLEEARDALPAISTIAARLYNIRLDLADRMDRVGNLESWKEMDAARSASSQPASLPAPHKLSEPGSPDAGTYDPASTSDTGTRTPTTDS